MGSEEWKRYWHSIEKTREDVTWTCPEQTTQTGTSYLMEAFWETPGHSAGQDSETCSCMHKGSQQKYNTAWNTEKEWRLMSLLDNTPVHCKYAETWTGGTQISTNGNSEDVRSTQNSDRQQTGKSLAHVTSPCSIIPPNSWPVICNSFSGNWGKNLYSSNMFRSIHTYKSCKVQASIVNACAAH